MGKVKTILLIDDEPCVLRVMRLFLQAAFVVLEAPSAEKALDKVAQSDKNVDLVISDVTLCPGTSGLDVVLTLKASMPDLKVILASGSPRDTWTEKHSALVGKLPPDSLRFLQKPFSAMDLLRTVDELIGPPFNEEVPFAGTASA
jgi:two-component system, cell cycle sensor histidine kinase and response regulator CckA